MVRPVDVEPGPGTTSGNVLEFIPRKNQEIGRVSGGELRFCAGCEHFGLSFGTVHLRLSPANLVGLAGLTHRLIERARTQGFPRERTHIAIGDRCVSLALWPGQLISLGDLLEQGLQLAAVCANKRCSGSEA